MEKPTYQLLSDTEPSLRGIEIYRKKNAVYTSFKITDLFKTLKGKYNHSNKKEVEASFSTPLFSQFGTEKTLTPEEAAEQHRGSIRSRIKLHTEMSENEVLKKILIPAAIEYGLEPCIFPLQEGENPLARTKGPFIKEHYFYSFTNELNITWVAYVGKYGQEIWISNNSHLVNWRWTEYNDATSTGSPLAPWVLSEQEQQWFSLILEMSDKLSSLLRKFSQEFSRV
jgi:hypothetical protein